jgi:hypothetical protein
MKDGMRARATKSGGRATNKTRYESTVIMTSCMTNLTASAISWK